MQLVLVHGYRCIGPSRTLPGSTARHAKSPSSSHCPGCACLKPCTCRIVLQSQGLKPTKCMRIDYIVINPEHLELRIYNNAQVVPYEDSPPCSSSFLPAHSALRCYHRCLHGLP